MTHMRFALRFSPNTRADACTCITAHDHCVPDDEASILSMRISCCHAEGGGQTWALAAICFYSLVVNNRRMHLSTFVPSDVGVNLPLSEMPLWARGSGEGRSCISSSAGSSSP